ncbi:MAG TPA: metal-dependent transcriptional regulator [Aggregatilineales bacterium]|nr:metal-dependent transcriptional regulator [Aggregatilineales bacterium]
MARPDTDSDISAKMSDYLVEIYRLSERSTDENAYISTSALADLLDVTAPAVNRMVTRLKDLGLLTHEPYQGIKLTDSGRREALIRLRVHRTVEAFLGKVMGFQWHEVYDEARRISGNLSEAVVRRMWEMAGEPDVCPHGEPIPEADGSLPPLDDVLLAEAQVNTHYAITRVLTREADRLSYLAALGLVPGAHLQLIHAAPFNGPLQLKLGDEYRIIGHNLAEAIRVHRLD